MPEVKTGDSKLPKELFVFAKSMGLSLDGLEPEAADIWKMLNDLSTSNPLEYHRFVSEQMDNAKQDAEMKPEDDQKSFRPEAGFCLKTSAVPNDGPKVCEVNKNNKTEGKTLYINMCSSVIIDAPTDKAGNEVLGMRSVADGLSIPLIVGAVRDIDEGHCLALDVVFHPTIMKISKQEQYFKAQVSELAIHWIKEETEMKLESNWEFFTDSLYKGGRGENKEIPVLFIVDKDGQVLHKKANKTEEKNIIGNTSSLLGKIKEDTVEEETQFKNIEILKSNDVSKKSNLIQEIGGPKENEKKKPIKNNENSNKTENIIPPTKTDNREIDSLFATLDNDFKNQDLDFNDALQGEFFVQDLAKVLIPGFEGNKSQNLTVNNPSINLSNVANNPVEKPYFQIFNDQPLLIKINVTLEEEGNIKFVKLVASGIDLTMDPSKLELLVSEDQARVQIPKAIFGVKCIGNSLILDKNESSAGFKKKKGLLTVKINCRLTK